MKIYILSLICMLLISTASHAASLSDLKNELRVITAELTDSTSFYTDSMMTIWLNLAQDRIVRLGGHIPKHIDIAYSLDSNSYNLPSGFISITGATVKTNSLWFPAFLVNSFVDSPFVQIRISWKDEDSAEVMISQKSLQNNDTLRIDYLSTAPSMEYDTSTCQVPEDLQGFIVEEAYSYYIMSQKRFQEALLLQSKIRQDMGVAQ